MAYDFHYTPTGTGVISGKEVLEQTEDAINDLGNTAISGVQEALDKAEQALTNSANAVDDAQTALNTANNAEGVAIQAQTDVGNLSGTVTNIGNRVTTAEGNISNLQGRMTTAEGNIGNLQGRMTTAETNIGNLQTAVSTAQATANSAQQTATTARQQSYVLRYSSSSVTDNSTIAYSTLDNTDNVKTGDKVIDVNGKIFSVVSVDTANQTVTVGSALIDLANDSDVVHISGNETISGDKTFSSDITLKGTTTPVIKTISNIVQDSTGNNESISWVIRDKTDSNTVFAQSVNKFSGQSVDWRLDITSILNGTSSTRGTRLVVDPVNGSYCFTSSGNNTLDLGSSTNRWKSVYAMNYYYGANNVEFSDKFVTTDTEQTITYPKTFTTTPSFTGYPSIRLYSPTDDVNVLPSVHEQREIRFTDKNNILIAYFIFQHRTDANEPFRTCWRQGRLDGTDNYYSVNFNNLGEFYPENNNGIKLGTSTKRWKDCQTNLINGLTPSSLGMPTDNIANIIDISGYLTVLDGSQANTYQAPDNGYIGITMSNCTGIQAYITGLWGHQIVRPTVGGVRFFMPVLKNKTANILIFGGTIDNARFIPCQGNV